MCCFYHDFCLSLYRNKKIKK